MKSIACYKKIKVCQIELKDGNVIEQPIADMSKAVERLNKEKFVLIGGEIINTLEIKKIKEITKNSAIPQTQEEIKREKEELQKRYDDWKKLQKQELNTNKKEIIKKYNTLRSNFGNL